ncbi:MAG TPA: DNA ligase D [Gemmatimonadaceae bacterium]
MTKLAPMLATIGSELPPGEGWVFEPKYDGIRILAAADDGEVALVSRNGLDKTRQFPEIADAVRALNAKAKRAFVIDGEIVAVRNGKPGRFQELQSRMHVTDPRAIERHRHDAPTAFMVFDILLDGKTSRVEEPWRSRRKNVEALLRSRPRSGPIQISDVGTDGVRMLRDARRHGWEGVIAKRADAPYLPGRRSGDWRKLKVGHQQEFVIGGWTEPRRSREHIGAILLGYYNEEGKLVYAGHTGTGFTRAALADLYKKLSRIERTKSPFTTTPRTNERAHWTRPSVVAEIKFNEWTTDGRLRQPVFLGIRDDKSAREVVAERPMSRSRKPTSDRVRARPAKRAAASVRTSRRSTRKRGAKKHTAFRSSTPRVAERVARQLKELEQEGGGVLELPSGELEVSNLDKVFFPETKTTKGDLMRYYALMSPYLLPAIADRPLVMKRYPNGVRGKAFYQQRAPATVPEQVRVETVSDKGYAAQEKIIGGDLATLLYVVQLGAVSIDPWHSRVQSIPYADYAIIDLDPGPRASFDRVVDVALAVKEVLDHLGLHAVPKTSGATGLHVVLPLPPRVPNDGARMLAEIVATQVAKRHPKIATVIRSVSDRPRGTIYVDYLQNIRGKTVAGVYSVRAESTPRVSTPLAWEEVREGLSPTDFTIDMFPDRMRDVGDLWAKGMRKPNKLDRVLRRG